MTKETRMGRFEEYGTGFKSDFDIRVGPARSAWDCRVFAGELRADVERVLGIAFEVTDDGRDPTGVTVSGLQTTISAFMCSWTIRRGVAPGQGPRLCRADLPVRAGGDLGTRRRAV